MPQSTQSKFTAQLKNRVEALGYELIQNHNWSNTGQFLIQKPDSLRPVLTIAYNFQGGYQTFDVTGELGTEHNYARHDELDAFLDRVAGNLPRLTKTRRPRVIESSAVQVALMELIEQAAREDDGNFFAGAGVGNYAGVTRVTLASGEIFTVIARKAEGSR
jgi:hypothetical protein